MKDMYVYILECADDSFYVGVTNDVGRRFIEHVKGVHETSFTFNRRPLKLVYCKHFDSPMKGKNFENQTALRFCFNTPYTYDDDEKGRQGEKNVKLQCCT